MRRPYEAITLFLPKETGALGRTDGCRAIPGHGIAGVACPELDPVPDFEFDQSLPDDFDL